MEKNTKKTIMTVLKTLFVLFTIFLYMQVTATLGKGTIDFTQPLPWTFDNFYANLVLFPMAHALNYFKDLTGSYGYAIMLLTVTVNIVGFPVFAYSEYRRVLAEPIQKKMQEERERIEKKYEGKDDPDSRNAKQRELLQSTQANGGMFGAMGGCFPQVMVMSFSLLFLSSIFFLTRTYQPLKDETFIWMQLGHFDMIMMIILILVAVASAYFMQPRDARNIKSQQFTSAVSINVMMYGVFAFINNSAFALYSVVNMIIMMIRTDTIRTIVARLKKSGKIKDVTKTANSKVTEADVVKVTKKY